MKRSLRAKLILASASPRRKSLLEEAGYEFTVEPSEVDEDAFRSEGIDAGEFAKIVARAKADPVAARHRADIVLAADTVVNARGQIIGKPKDAEHARQIVRMLFSAPHEVITGIALFKLDEHIEEVHAVTSIIYPRQLTDSQIEAHIKSGDWEGKAGAYGIQERDEFIDHVDGSFTNVMGLPMELVTELLQQFRE
jgi:septum formation protein